MLLIFPSYFSVSYFAVWMPVFCLFVFWGCFVHESFCQHYIYHMMDMIFVDIFHVHEKEE